MVWSVILKKKNNNKVELCLLCMIIKVYKKFHVLRSVSFSKLKVMVLHRKMMIKIRLHKLGHGDVAT